MQDRVKWGKSRQTRYYRDNSDSAAAHNIEETLAWVDAPLYLHQQRRDNNTRILRYEKGKLREACSKRRQNDANLEPAGNWKKKCDGSQICNGVPLQKSVRKKGQEAFAHTEKQGWQQNRNDLTLKRHFEPWVMYVETIRIRRIAENWAKPKTAIADDQ